MFSTKRAMLFGANGLAVMSYQRGLFQQNISVGDNFVSAVKPKVTLGTSSGSDAFCSKKDDYDECPEGDKKVCHRLCKDGEHDPQYQRKDSGGKVQATWLWKIDNRDCSQKVAQKEGEFDCHPNTITKMDLPSNFVCFHPYLDDDECFKTNVSKTPDDLKFTQCKLDMCAKKAITSNDFESHPWSGLFVTCDGYVDTPVKYCKQVTVTFYDWQITKMAAKNPECNGGEPETNAKGGFYFMASCKKSQLDEGLSATYLLKDPTDPLIQ